MKIKLAELKTRHQSLCVLGNKKLPIKLSYAIGKNIMKLQSEVDDIEKARINLLEQYAEKNEDGTCKKENGHYQLGDNKQAFADEYNEFLDAEQEIDIYTVPEEVVESMDDSRYDVLTVAELIALEFMLEKPIEQVELEV